MKMKKEYVSPSIQVLQIVIDNILSGSGEEYSFPVWMEVITDCLLILVIVVTIIAKKNLTKPFTAKPTSGDIDRLAFSGY